MYVLPAQARDTLAAVGSRKAEDIREAGAMPTKGGGTGGGGGGGG